MSESEKKGSPWPWIVVPLASLGTFLLLRECQHRLPPEAQSHSPTVTAPADAAAPATAGPDSAGTPATPSAP